MQKPKPNALQYIRDFYGVPARKGGRITYGGIGGTILGGKNAYLRVRLDGFKRTVLLHPTFAITYLTEKAP